MRERARRFRAISRQSERDVIGQYARRAHVHRYQAIGLDLRLDDARRRFHRDVRFIG